MPNEEGINLNEIVSVTLNGHRQEVKQKASFNQLKSKIQPCQPSNGDQPENHEDNDMTG